MTSLVVSVSTGIIVYKNYYKIDKTSSNKDYLKELEYAYNNILNSYVEKVDEKEFVRIEALICSMTDKERRNPKILNASRRIRIAKGSGTSVQEINKFMKSFEMTQKMMKKMKDSKSMKKMMSQMKNMDPKDLKKMM